MVSKTELEVRVAQVAPCLKSGKSYLSVLLREVDETLQRSCNSMDVECDPEISRAVQEHVVHVIARSDEPMVAARRVRQLLKEPWAGTVWVVFNAIRLGFTELEEAIEEHHIDRKTGNLL